MVMVKDLLVDSELSLPLPETHAGDFSSLYRRMSAAERYAFRLSLCGAQKGQERANWLTVIGSFSMAREHFCSSINIAFRQQ